MDIPLHASCRILRYDKSGLIAVDKAADVLSHPNAPRDRAQSLIGLAYDKDLEAYGDGERQWHLLNRLDGPTSGIILLADNAEMAGTVRQAFQRHLVEKSYMAVLKGVPSRNREVWRDCLVTSKRRNVLRTAVGRGKRNAETRIQVKDRAGSPPARTLVRLDPLTGKTHQLRVQCASRHMPIIGDATYGAYAFNREFRRKTGEGRLFLHSWRIRLKIELNGQNLDFSAESPLPEAFTVALR